MMVGVVLLALFLAVQAQAQRLGNRAGAELAAAYRDVDPQPLGASGPPGTVSIARADGNHALTPRGVWHLKRFQEYSQARNRLILVMVLGPAVLGVPILALLLIRKGWVARARARARPLDRPDSASGSPTP